MPNEFELLNQEVVPANVGFIEDPTTVPAALFLGLGALLVIIAVTNNGGFVAGGANAAILGIGAMFAASGCLIAAVGLCERMGRRTTSRWHMSPTLTNQDFRKFFINHLIGTDISPLTSLSALVVGGEGERGVMNHDSTCDDLIKMTNHLFTKGSAPESSSEEERKCFAVAKRALNAIMADRLGRWRFDEQRHPIEDPSIIQFLVISNMVGYLKENLSFLTGVDRGELQMSYKKFYNEKFLPHCRREYGEDVTKEVVAEGIMKLETFVDYVGIVAEEQPNATGAGIEPNATDAGIEEGEKEQGSNEPSRSLQPEGSGTLIQRSAYSERRG